MRYLFFDTETNSLPLNYKAPVTQVDNWPRIIQLAWAKFEGTLEINSKVDLIFPDSWVMPTEKFWVDNGFSQINSIFNGIPIKSALEEFIKAINSSDFLIAHNMNFDSKIIGAEMIRANLKAERNIPKLCTMEASTDFCQLQGQYGKYKWPKLDELHNKLFNIGFEGAHDAMIDVRACARCYFELKRLNIIN